MGTQQATPKNLYEKPSDPLTADLESNMMWVMQPEGIICVRVIRFNTTALSEDDQKQKINQRKLR